tara:strand:- start:217 stop:573 length:357 start_codon:yes stop_codon:yes gene_type:complete
MKNQLLWNLIVRYCDLESLNALRLTCKKSKYAIDNTVYKIINRTVSNSDTRPELQYMNGEYLWQWFNEEFCENRAKVYHGGFVGHLTVELPDVYPFSTFGVMLTSINFSIWKIEVIGG